MNNKTKIWFWLISLVIVIMAFSGCNPFVDPAVSVTQPAQTDNSAASAGNTPQPDSTSPPDEGTQPPDAQPTDEIPLINPLTGLVTQTPPSTDSSDFPTSTPGTGDTGDTATGASYEFISDSAIGLGFERPNNWEKRSYDGRVIYVEGIEKQPAKITIEVTKLSGNLSDSKVSDNMKELMATLKADFRNGFTARDQQSGRMLGVDGVDCEFICTSDDGTDMRGRVLMVSTNSRLYMMRVYGQAANWTNIENVFRQLRSTLAIQ